MFRRRDNMRMEERREPQRNRDREKETDRQLLRDIKRGKERWTLGGKCEFPWREDIDKRFWVNWEWGMEDEGKRYKDGNMSDQDG